MSESIFERVENFLRQQGIDFQVLRHEPVFTSEQAAAVRGVPLASGAKALVCKVDDQFALFVIPADRKLDGKRVRQALRSRSLRFATGDELQQLTGLAPGAVPPLGHLFGLATYCDSQMAGSDKINFNAGDHSISVSMRWVDYLRVANPTLGSFTT